MSIIINDFLSKGFYLNSVIMQCSLLKNSFVFSFFILSWLPSLHSQKAIIFDLGGVLFQKKSSFSLVRKHVGLPLIIAYALCTGIKVKQLKKTVFQLLDQIKPRTFSCSFVPHDDHGDPLPLLMQEWLEGQLTSKAVLDFIKEQSCIMKKLFRTKSEKIIFLRIVHLIFDPHLFIQTQEVHPEALFFIKKLKDEGFKLYVLSNWDAESFILLKESHKELFALFDGVSISADFKCSKPSIQLYESFLSFHNLRSSECIFVDDQLINITGALTAGISGLVCPQKRSTLFGNKIPHLAQLYTHIKKASYPSFQLA